MALRVKKITPGKFVGGRFVASKKNPFNFEVKVYQDTDPRGKREWYGYLSRDGHIFKNFGPYRTKAQALRAGRRFANVKNSRYRKVKNASIRKLKKEWSGYGREWRRSQIRVTKARAKARRKTARRR
jgi:hypothetical protein